MAGERGRTLKLQIVGDVGDIKKDVASVNKAIGGLGKAAKGIGAAVAGAFAVDAVIDFAGSAIDAASDLNESMSKVGVVFGDSADAIERWSRDAAQNMGLSQQAALEAAGTFGNLFDALKMTDEAQRDMSKGAVQLASDLASFSNADVSETLAAIQSGLLGEAEPMRRFGSNLSEARVQAYALAKGWVKNKQALTDQQKVQARYNLILEDTVNAQGDYARTSDGVANKARTAAAKAADLQAEIGQLLIPLRDIALDVGMKAVDVIRDLGDAFHDLERFMSPHLAAVEDQRDELYQYAEQVGADVDSLRSWIDAQDAARKAADAHEQSIEGLHEQARIFADLYEQQVHYLDDGVMSAEEAADSSRYVTEQMRNLGYVVNEAGDQWVRYEDSAEGAAEKTAEMSRQLSLFGQSAQSQARLAPLARAAAIATTQVYTSAVTDWKKAAKDYKHVGVQFAEGNDALVADLKATRTDVKAEMRSIKAALLDPFAGDDLERTYRKAVKDGTAAMNKALKTGNEAAYAEASEFVRKYKAKLRELRQQRFRVRVQMFIDDSGITGPGATLLGGAAGAAWGVPGARRNNKPKDKPGRNHAAGIDYVPYDDYPARLHRGEAVVTERENAGRSSGTTNVSVVINAGVGSDPVAIGRELDRYLAQYYRRTGGVRAYS